MENKYNSEFFKEFLANFLKGFEILDSLKKDTSEAWERNRQKLKEALPTEIYEKIFERIDADFGRVFTGDTIQPRIEIDETTYPGVWDISKDVLIENGFKFVCSCGGKSAYGLYHNSGSVIIRI